LNRMDKAEAQRRIDSIQWYHEFDFGNGLRAEAATPDAPSHRKLWKFIESELDNIDFVNKFVLDVGCWDGYWSFYAERRGAARVWATDDAGQNWAGDSGLRLAKELLGSQRVNLNTNLSVYDLSTHLRERFDVVLCLGVYYHLFDPFYAFAQLRHCSHENSIVVIEGDVRFGLEPGSALYSDDLTKAPRYVPGHDTLKMLLRAAYLEPIHQAMYVFHQSGDTEIIRFETVDTQIAVPNGAHRILLMCRPVMNEVYFHRYRPPFGLEIYDKRYGRAPQEWMPIFVSEGRGAPG
jgi:tRNA (mo5U34)-methyltransferase